MVLVAERSDAAVMIHDLGECAEWYEKIQHMLKMVAEECAEQQSEAFDALIPDLWELRGKLHDVLGGDCVGQLCQRIMRAAVEQTDVIAADGCSVRIGDRVVEHGAVEVDEKGNVSIKKE